jgi:hypothetical protein
MVGLKVCMPGRINNGHQRETRLDVLITCPLVGWLFVSQRSCHTEPNLIPTAFKTLVLFIVLSHLMNHPSPKRIETIFVYA